jgi:16S rRNA (adenine1518-N6/adenine1519-N6)-dimethyltransferase
MCHILEKRISDDWNDSDVAISLRHMDVLDFDQEEYAEYDLIANIPYYITSPILHHFLYGVQCVPKNMTILMQKDVADKILQYFE